MILTFDKRQILDSDVRRTFLGPIRISILLGRRNDFPMLSPDTISANPTRFSDTVSCSKIVSEIVSAKPFSKRVQVESRIGNIFENHFGKSCRGRNRIAICFLRNRIAISFCLQTVSRFFSIAMRVVFLVGARKAIGSNTF